MIFDYDPRDIKGGVNSESASYRLLKDILVEQIVNSLSTGTASNYITRSYGSNHRILYEGAARLFAEIILKSADNIEDVEYSQLRAEYISTRLLYSVFPSEDSIPEGDNVEDVIRILLQTYESLLAGATKKSIDQTLEAIASNAVVFSEVQDYILNVNTSILATTETNTDGIVGTHRHYAFAKPTGYGATNKPIGYRWGDILHHHEIIDGVVQPHIDEDGVSHTHEIYFGLPENTLQLQSNLLKTLSVLKPAHLRIGGVSSVISERDRISPNANDVIDGLDSISLGLGSLYQEDLRRARVGVPEDEIFGYAEGNQIRFWKHDISIADNLCAVWEDIDPNTLQKTVYSQKLRAIDTQDEIPNDQVDFSTGDTLTFIREVGTQSAFATDVRLKGGAMLPPEAGEVGSFNSVFANDGEPLLYSREGKVYYPSLLGYEGDAVNPPLKPYGYRVSLSASVVTVDSQVLKQGLVKFRLTSNPWTTRREISYFTESFEAIGNNADVLDLPSNFQKKVLKTHSGVPIISSDFILKVNGVVLEDFFLDVGKNKISSTGAFARGDDIEITYPKASSEVRLFRELNNLEITLNATRPVRSVSLSGRGGDSQRVISTTPPLSYVLNSVAGVLPLTQSEKTSTYSVQNSDILNTRNQNLNSTFTLNRGSLNQNLSQDQVYAPATKTLTATKSEIFFTQLGFIPSFVYSVVDQNAISYTFKVTQTSLILDGYTSPVTLTISAVSSMPLNLEQDWFKGERLAEGQAFLAKKSTLGLPDLLEDRPQDIIQNPLGIDRDRNIIANRVVKELGHRGEYAFYEDEVASYNLNGSSGFLNDLNIMSYKDEMLHQDPTLYILGPRTETETSTVNTIPTYLFFNYLFLNTFGGDSHYFSIYRVGLDGVKYYQTITPRADSNGFSAVEEYPNLPAPNGAPLAYRFVDDGSGGGFNLNYSNGDLADNFLAEVNASFNHIPNQTYFIELFMEEDGGGADSLFFFSSGSDASIVLGASWDTSNETYRLDDAFGGGLGVTYYYEVLFATNPGEVVSFDITLDEFPAYPKDPENIGLTHDILEVAYYAEDVFPTPTLGFDSNVNFMPSSPDGSTPYFRQVEDELAFDAVAEHGLINLVSDNESGLTFSSLVSASLFLRPSSVDEIIATPEDEVGVALRYQIPNLEEEISLSDEIEYTYDLGNVLIEDDLFLDDEVSTHLEYLAPLLESDASLSDEVTARITSFKVDSNSSISDEVGTIYSFTPSSVGDSSPAPSDVVTTTFSYQTPELNTDVPVLTDGVSIRTPSVSLSSLLELSDEVSASYSLSPVHVESSLGFSDTVSILPNYQPVTLDDDYPLPTDDVIDSLSLLTSDTVFISDEVDTSYLLSNIAIEDNVTVDDETTVVFRYTPISVESSNASISDGTEESLSLFYTDTTSLSDEVSTQYNYASVSEGSVASTYLDDVSTTSRYLMTGTVEAQDEVSISVALNKSVGDTVSCTDEISITPSLSPVEIGDAVSASDEVDTSYSLSMVSLEDVVSASDEVDITLNEPIGPLNVESQLSFTDEVVIVERAEVSSSLSLSDEANTSIGEIVTPSLILGIKYNDFAFADNELFSIYKGSMDTLVYPDVFAIQPDSNSISPVVVAEDSKEIRISAALADTSYSNANDDANLRIGSLEYDTNYTLYAYTEFLDSSPDISAAFRAGSSALDPSAFLFGKGYNDLMPGNPSSGDSGKYYLHTFRIRSSDDVVVFNADNPNTFPFGFSSNARLYMHFKFTHSVSGDDSAVFRLREAKSEATFSSPDGSPADTTGWVAPSIHASIAGLSNSAPSGNYVETTLPNSTVSNTDNDAQVSWDLTVGTRYHLQTTQYDNNPDFEVCLEARAEDSGASWDTTYSSSDTLEYTELLTNNDGLETTWNHFFTIRKDGFIIWEQDPSGS